jgi:FSR family fosmidomycin resistance protein-like MFS transporter
MLSAKKNRGQYSAPIGLKMETAHKTSLGRSKFTGSSLFHPPVTGMVTLYAGRNLGLAMSVYNTAGTLAFGVGPIFITWYVARFGLRAMPVTRAIGLSIWIYIYWVIPKPKGDGMAQYGFLETLRQTL